MNKYANMYIAPSLEIFNLDADQMICVSNVSTIDNYNYTVDTDWQ